MAERQDEKFQMAFGLKKPDIYQRELVKKIYGQSKKGSKKNSEMTASDLKQMKSGGNPLMNLLKKNSS